MKYLIVCAMLAGCATGDTGPVFECLGHICVCPVNKESTVWCEYNAPQNLWQGCAPLDQIDYDWTKCVIVK